jgi:hypothetical protein
MKPVTFHLTADSDKWNQFEIRDGKNVIALLYQYKDKLELVPASEVYVCIGEREDT